jgi:nitrate/nitrite transport system ATP-binding protein
MPNSQTPSPNPEKSMQTLNSKKTTKSSKAKTVTPFLSIKDVSKVYENPKDPQKPFVILDGVNLQINEGEFICLIGHSGCGKSTLLNMIAGFNGPTEGEVALEGARITEPGPDRMVVFQNYSLLPWLTATENIHLGVETVYAEKSADEHNTIVKENLELVGLTEACDKRPGQLSGGMKQRVAIARALATRPKLLILDEPFGALDPITREELQEELLKIWRKNKITVIMITHDIDEALFLADRVVMMTNGPAASIGEDMRVPFSRPRDRTRIMEDPKYYELRNFALEFLFDRYAHTEGEEESEAEAALPPLPASAFRTESVPVGLPKTVAPAEFLPHVAEPTEASRIKGAVLGVSWLFAMTVLAAVNLSSVASQQKQKLAEPVPTPAAVISSPPTPLAPTATATTAPTATATTAPTATGTTSGTSEITDKTELGAIEKQLYTQIDQNWKTTPSFTESLTYRVKVKQNGDIVQFEPTNKAAKDFVQEIPLPVLQIPVDPTTAVSQKTAEFQVTFTPTSGKGGVLEVKAGK